LVSGGSDMVCSVDSRTIIKDALII
jgi:hypothetical protein